MAALQSSRLPAPSSPVSRRLTAPAAPKLRDSCHACASSKLRCTKEKPTCSRCAKRGLSCEYVATKRGGRKHDARSSSNNNGGNTSPGATSTINETQLLTPLSAWFIPNSTISCTDSLPQPSKNPTPGPSRSDASSNLFPSLLSPVEQSLSSITTDPTTDLNDFGGSPISFSLPEISDTDILGQVHPFPIGVESSNNTSACLFDRLPVSEDALSEIFALSNPRSPPNSHPSPTSDSQSCQSSCATDSTCFCLVSALSLMKQLFHKSSTACSISTMQGFDNPTSFPTISTVIARNEYTIEAVSTMLQCSCSQDGYLLAIMSLIVFKILGWYAAAARRTPSSGHDSTKNPNNNNNNSRNAQSPRKTHSRCISYSEQVLNDPAVIGSYCLDGEDSARMAAQLVLSELHRVQRLVNQLSAKLKMQAAKDRGMGDPAGGSDTEDADCETPLPLSAVMLNQLEVDLRKRLKALSLEIAEGLKRE